jgi:hypothetical protein
MPRKVPEFGPIITLTSDFGMADAYVAQMKLALLRHAPSARLVDVTHAIAPQDVLGGSIQLERAIAAAEPGAFHLAVVDPGVGSNRRILVTVLSEQTIVCPDNGLITWAWRRLGPGKSFELAWRPTHSSTTFHGRDIMAPALGMLASGTKLTKLARPIADPLLLDVHLADPADRAGRVIHIDHFGNATSNIPAEMLDPDDAVRIGRRSVNRIRKTYADVPPGKPLALIGSAGLLEIAVRNGSAQRTLRLKIGDEVTLVR